MLDSYLFTLTFRIDEKLELRHLLEGHQLGVVSVDINADGTCILYLTDAHGISVKHDLAFS